MHTFEQKPEATRQTSSGKSRNHPAHSGQAVQRLPDASTMPVQEDSITEIARFGHDFSRIPENANGNAGIQPQLGHDFRQVRVHADARSAETADALNADAFGRPLDSSVLALMGPRFGHDLSNVRIHADREAGKRAASLGARAFTLGNHISFGVNEYLPHTRSGQTLLAHELTHVVQFGRTAGPVSSAEGLEAEAVRAGASAASGRFAGPITGRASPAMGPLRDDKKKDDEPPNPFADWKSSPDSMLLIFGDDRLFILPGADTVFFPTEQTQKLFEQSSAHVTQDLGTLFEVPATGASGTRIFQAGRRSALVLDAGYDPTPGQSQRVAAVYVNQVVGIATRLGIRKVSRIQPIHGHSDHVAGFPALISNFQVKPENVVIPAEFETLSAVQQVERILRDPNNTALTSRGFGPGWNPQRPPKDKGGAGDLYQGSFMIGELVVDLVGLRSALRTARANPDLASYVTKVTRRTDNAKVVVLGDLRGADLTAIRNEMEQQAPGSWDEFFRGVTTISGFSHHVGRMEQGDVSGIMSLLDATLLKTGRLRVVEQTNRNVSAQARADTLELAARLGIEVSYTGMPTAGAPPSAVGATRDTTYTHGTDAAAQPVINSALTAGLQRLRRLVEAQGTIEAWRPWLEELNGKSKLDAVASEFASSITQLRQSLRQASEAAVGIRAAPRPAAATGPRDYTAAGGAAGRAFETSLAAIPNQVPAERTLTAEAERALEELRNKNIEEVPLKVALYRAVTRGEYSDQAFTYMMGQLNPLTRDELIGRKPGTLGALVPRNVAFARVRAQFNFERGVLPGETISIQHLSPTGQVGARGVAGVLLAVELWNDIGQPLWQAHKLSQQVSITKNLAPFLRRLAFWQQLGVKTKFFGIVDPSFGSPQRIDDPAAINQKLVDGDLDALIIEKPGLTDADVLALAVTLAQKVRNYDEYATLFEDSFQDAVTYDSKGGAWSHSDWKVRVGHYETSGSNHVEEEWYVNDKLTQFMRHYIPWLIANTQVLLDQAGKAGPAPAGLEATLGNLSPTVFGGNALKRVKLKRPQNDLIVRVPWTGVLGGSEWGPGGAKGSELAKMKFHAPPMFYVLDKSGDEIKVIGADFETYAMIRDLATTNWEVGTYGSELSHEYLKKDKNQKGWVWIDEILTEPVP
jgi:hypothetical protein